MMESDQLWSAVAMPVQNDITLFIDSHQQFSNVVPL